MYLVIIYASITFQLKQSQNFLVEKKDESYTSRHFKKRLGSHKELNFIPSKNYEIQRIAQRHLRVIIFMPRVTANFRKELASKVQSSLKRTTKRETMRVNLCELRKTDNDQYKQ